MAENVEYTPLPADLPEDWTVGQTVAPAGADVGLPPQYGFNYLNAQLNNTQRAVNQLAAAKQDKLTGTAGQVVGFNAEGEAEAQPGVGRSMAGQTVEPVQGTTVTAGAGAEVFNEYYTRQYGPDSGFELIKPQWGNVASGIRSHAEGHATTASGPNSHAEGNSTAAIGSASHSEGSSYSGLEGSKASGLASHAEGMSTLASGSYSHAEGDVTVASSKSSHAEGHYTTASGEFSHAEGQKTTASDSASHAEGETTTASGFASHAEGLETTANGTASHAAGYGTIATKYQTVVGTYNVEMDSGSYSGTRFIVGGGSDSTRQNAFRVHSSGACYGSGAWNSSGADYAELFEWLDGNPNAEDRAGLFVTLEGDHLRLAGPEDDFILGIVSADPSVVGDVYDDQWAGMYLRDVFGRTIMEMQDFPAEITQVPREDGTMETVELIPARRELAPVVNPEYDHTVKYLPRTQRPEWDAVGMMGKLVAVDDGTCQVNGWCAVGEGGKATHSDTRTRYRVMARLDETHIRVLIL